MPQPPKQMRNQLLRTALTASHVSCKRLARFQELAPSRKPHNLATHTRDGQPVHAEPTGLLGGAGGTKCSD